MGHLSRFTKRNLVACIKGNNLLELIEDRWTPSSLLIQMLAMTFPRLLPLLSVERRCILLLLAHWHAVLLVPQRIPTLHAFLASHWVLAAGLPGSRGRLCCCLLPGVSFRARSDLGDSLLGRIKHLIDRRGVCEQLGLGKHALVMLDPRRISGVE